jgi:hypothetical protein
MKAVTFILVKVRLLYNKIVIAVLFMIAKRYMQIKRNYVIQISNAANERNRTIKI